MKKFITIYKRAMNKMFALSCLKTDRRIFALLFNFKSFLIGSPARIRWIGSVFVVYDKHYDGFSFTVRHQKQANLAYWLGFRERANYLADCYFLNKINFASGDTIIDCGANVGDIFLSLKVLSIPLKYIGFEPSPIEFSCLNKNVDSGVVYNCGLWKNAGKLKFFVSSQGADSSLIEPRRFDQVINVPVVTLDKFIDRKIKCLKLEAEGAEPEVLLGLGEKLKYIEFICADVGFERGKNSESTLAPTANYLIARGFTLEEINLSGRICALFKNKDVLS